MDDKKFIELVSLVMCCLKFNMQILEYVCLGEDITRWREFYGRIEDNFDEIVNQFIEGNK